VSSSRGFDGFWSIWGGVLISNLMYAKLQMFGIFPMAKKFKVGAKNMTFR